MWRVIFPYFYYFKGMPVSIRDKVLLRNMALLLPRNCNSDKYAINVIN